MSLPSPTQALTAAITKMVARIEADGVEQDQVMFAGNWHDAVPRLLVHDPALLPLDLAVWMVLKAYCSPAAPAAFVGGLYGTLTTHTKCNRATVATSLARMRMLRWVSVCATVRRQNQYRGQVYALHDQPISLADACRLDPEYMTFVQGGLTHRDSGIVEIARDVLATIDQNINAGIESFESDTLDRMGRRMEALSTPPTTATDADSESEPFFAVNRQFRKAETKGSISPSSKSELGEISESKAKIGSPHGGATQKNQVVHGGPLQDNAEAGTFSPSSDFELGRKIEVDAVIEVVHRGPSSKSTKIEEFEPSYVKQHSCSSSYLNKTTTTTEPEETLTHARAMAGETEKLQLVLPVELDANERNLAMRYLVKVAQEHQQPLLDELSGRIKSGKARGDPVRNPIAYLNRLIDLCLAGRLYQSSNAARVARERRQAKQVKQVVPDPKTFGVAVRPLDRTQLERRVEVLKHAAGKSTKP